MCLRVLSIIIGMSLIMPIAHALDAEPPVSTLDAIEPVQVKQFVKERAQDAHDLALGNPAPQVVMPTNLDCATLYNRRVALMRGQVDRSQERLQEIPGIVPPLFDLPTGCAFAPRCQRADDLCRRERPAYEEKQSGHWAACWHTNG